MDSLDKEIARHERRRKRFEEEGLTPDEAYDLADKLFDRDRDEFDDRRLCFECTNYKDKEKLCTKLVDNLGKQQRPLRFILQRCDWFDLRSSK